MKQLIMLLVRIMSALIVVATFTGCAFQVEVEGRVSGSVSANGARRHQNNNQHVRPQQNCSQRGFRQQNFSQQGPYREGYRPNGLPPMDRLGYQGGGYRDGGYQRGGYGYSDQNEGEGELVFSRVEWHNGRQVVHRQYRVRRSAQVWNGGSAAPVCSPHRRCN